MSYKGRKPPSDVDSNGLVWSQTVRANGEGLNIFMEDKPCQPR